MIEKRECITMDKIANRKRKKCIIRIFAVLFSMIVLLGMPFSYVYADNDDRVYIVTLDPGTGTGTPVEYRSDKDPVLDSWRTAVENKIPSFYIEEDGSMAFYLNNAYCPKIFQPPYGHYFDGWEGNGTYNKLSSESMTFKAKWAFDLSKYGPIAQIPPADGGNVYVGSLSWKVIGMNESAWLLLLNSASYLKDLNSIYKDVFDDINRQFSEQERRLVIPTSKIDIEYGIFAPANLYEATFFLLSAAEADYYLPDQNAKKRSPYVWWLRSPVTGDSELTACINIRGKIALNNKNDKIFVFPAFQLNAAYILFTSPSEGGKSTAAAGTGEFGTFPASSEGVYKLTIIDPGRNGFTASAGGKVTAGGTLAVSYSGAGTGDSEYVSALLCDQDENALYYASLTPDSSGSGTWNMVIPENLAVGSTYILKVFSEQQNPYNYSDFSSAACEFELEVIQKDASGDDIPGYPPADNTDELRGWIWDDAGWHYYDQGVMVRTRWIPENGNWYYLDDQGVMATGWLWDGMNWYYLDPFTGVMQTGWLWDGYNWYYLDPYTGAMATGWVWDGTWYFLNPFTGAMQTGWVWDGTWYYLHPFTGAMQTGWVWDGMNWYYMNPFTGAMQTGWVWDGINWYYLNPFTGAMQTGWVWDGINWYYLNPFTGAMQTG